MSNKTKTTKSPIVEWIENESFEIIDDEKLSRKFPLKPDVLASKGENIQAYFIRKTDYIPEVFLQRLSLMKAIPTQVYEIIIAFEKKPATSIIRLCARYGIGVLSIGKRSCKLEQEAQKRGALLRITKTTKKRKMSQTDLFISSKQVLEERDIAKDIIDLIRNSMHKPIYAKLVEDDQRYNEMSKTKLKELIELCLNESDYTICFLSDEHRDIVEWEVKRALEILEIEQVIVFLKSSKEAQVSWNGLLSFIHFQYAANGRTVKYIEYTDLRDFRMKFHERIMILLSDIHKKMGIDLIQ